MGTAIISAVLGIACIILGCFTAKGKGIALLLLRRKRISEENLIPFGKQYSIALFVFGTAIILFGAVGFFSLQYRSESLIHIASIIGHSGMIGCLVISAGAINKYVRKDRR